jgi:hypothetical protein
MMAAVDWAAVTSAAITGAVGIAGVAGTIIAARVAGKSARESAQLSINAQADQARLADKRQVYAQALAALHAAMLAVQKLAVYQQKRKPEEVIATAREHALEVVRAALGAITEVQLITPIPLAQQCDEVMRTLYRTDSDPLLSEMSEAVNLLTRALRADLDQEGQPRYPLTSASLDHPQRSAPA